MPQITAGDKQAGKSILLLPRPCDFRHQLLLKKGLELKSKVKETCIRTLGFTGSRYGFWWNSDSKQVLGWDGSVTKLLAGKHNDLHSDPSNVHKNMHIMTSASKPSTGAAGGWLELTTQGVFKSDVESERGRCQTSNSGLRKWTPPHKMHQIDRW